MNKLILASASPRRQALLRGGGVDFEIRVSGVNEEDHAKGPREPSRSRPPWPRPARVAEGLEPGTIVLAADTMVIMDEKLFNKPADRGEARQMLRALSGRTHTVVTALALLRAGAEALVDAVYADVTFNALGDELIEAYLASGEADDKAGAYGIQGRGGAVHRRGRGRPDLRHRVAAGPPARDAPGDDGARPLR